MHSLGHIFSAVEVQADLDEVYFVETWPKLTNALHHFQGFSSYCRRYVLKFADIAVRLHAVTQRGVLFQCTSTHDEAFCNLKSVLTQVTILTYPDFLATAPPFVLQMDASAIVLVAVLEQGSHFMPATH